MGSAFKNNMRNNVSVHDENNSGSENAALLHESEYKRGKSVKKEKLEVFEIIKLLLLDHGHLKF